MKIITRRVIAFVFALLFVVAAPLLLLYAIGYRYSSKTHSFIKTGTFVISTIPEGADIYLNDQKYSSATPSTITSVPPATYELKLEKNGYYPWAKKFILEPDRAIFASGIRLFQTTSPTKQNADPLV